jgi:hypothetical protein
LQSQTRPHAGNRLFLNPLAVVHGRLDTPPLAFHGPKGEPSEGSSGGKIDTAEFLSAVGTFFAALAAFASVSVIVLREDVHVYGTLVIMAGWVVGVMMQIIAGAIARTRR